ncbi:hypothetical protein [Pseudomonas alabamensis]|uniref:hypothetical protein n=1 Tax=Pseudomonas alabamensis TaxID=3064349 RepID=UPI0021DA3733|nr:hypothetical protein [Pseudomonas entomophila]
MNPIRVMALLSALIVLPVLPVLPVHASPVAPSTPAVERNPYNSPIQRINPNSRQGSVPATPPVHGPSTVPQPRPPTLDNRGIGNGDNLRPAPRTELPRSTPTPVPRDATPVR